MLYTVAGILHIWTPLKYGHALSRVAILYRTTLQSEQYKSPNGVHSKGAPLYCTIVVYYL